MVMTPMIVKRQIALNPPSSSSSDPDPSEKLRFDVQVDASGAAYVDGVPVPVANVMKALLDKGAGPDSMVSVGADRSLPFQKVVDVLDQVKAAGISKLSIEVVER
jgi:biopolymer transport protein ExbD